jgi:hypothetical protein
MMKKHQIWGYNIFRQTRITTVMGITFQLMRVITTVIPSKNPQLQPLGPSGTFIHEFPYFPDANCYNWPYIDHFRTHPNGGFDRTF